MNIRMLLNLRNPIPNRFKRATVSNVVHQQNALSATEVRRRNSSESFLPRGIPDLKFDPFPIDLYIFDLEVNSNGGDKGR